MLPAKEMAEQKINCIYAAVNIMGANSTASVKGKKPRPTTEKVLEEAKKIWGWVGSEERSDK